MSGTTYPSTIDGYISLPLVVDLVSPVVAKDHNNLRNAIVVIETELGTNPSSTFGTVKDRLDSIESAVSSLTTNEIGTAEDGDYTDGLFVDFVPTTTIGTAVDRFNEVLKQLAPSPAPNLSNIGYTTSLGVAGKVSFGASNVIATYFNVSTADGDSALDINGTFTSASSLAIRKGIYTAGVNKAGELASNVAAGTGTPTPAYPAKAFGNADQGTLQLWINGALSHQVDLSTFGSGSSLNANGSGFTSLSAATDVSFPSGSPFTLFKYRTGQWIANSLDQRNGHNYIQVKHVVGATTYTTNFFGWVNDIDVTATFFASENLYALSMSGSKFISGVQYNTGGTASYDITISNLHRNTYSSSASAISHGASTNLSIPSTALGTIVAHTDSEIVTAKTATVNASRILGVGMTAKTLADRTVQSDLTSTGATITGLLVDNVTDDATSTNETINGEKFRVPSNRSLTDTSGFTIGGAGLWTSTNSLTTGPAGYLDGLLVYNGALYYPSSASVVNSGNFSTVANGPGGNPNYSTASGTRTYWRYFFFSSATQNFVMNVSSSGCSFISVATPLGSSNGNVHVELLAPNTTSNGVSVEFKDAVTAYTTDNAIGCFAATYGPTIPTNWGLTLGTKSTATSGSVIIIRITVGNGWTGTISNINVVGA